MKIAVLTGSISRRGGGFFTSVRRLAQCCVEQGAEVDVLTVSDVDTDRDVLDWLPVKPRVFAGRHGKLAVSPEMFEELRSISPDIVHVHGLWTHLSRISSEWTRLTGRPHVVSPRGMLDPWALRRSRWKKRIVGLAWEKKHLATAGCVHALCPSERSAIRDYGVKSPVCVIPNGVDLPDSGLAARPCWDDIYGEDTKILLYLGRLHVKKGLDVLLDAWETIKKSGDSENNWRLVIAGWGDPQYVSGLERRIREGELGKSVLLAGELHGSNKAAVLQCADAFVLPSYSEGLPMTVLEAWSYGRPVIITPECHLKEGFAEGAAIEINPDQRSIVEGLRHLFFMSEDELRGMGEKGKALAGERFVWPVIAEKMMKVYHWLVSNGPCPEFVEIRGEGC